MQFRDIQDPDERRKDIVWLACGLIVLLGGFLVLALLFGVEGMLKENSFEHTVLFAGMVAMIFVSVSYMISRERQHRRVNQRLLAGLRGAVGALHHRVERLNTLCTTSAELAGTLDIHRISQLVVGALITHAAANVSSLVLVDDHSGQQVFSDASAGDGKQDDNSALAELLAADPASQALADHLAAQGDERRIITAQFKPRTHLSGELRAGRGEGAAGFSTEDLDLLITLANMASKAIESAELHRELKDSYFNTVQSLANSLEARDNYTAKHAQRVTDLALRLARHLRERFDLTDEDFETLAAFGPLHDVGKIGMPDELLNRQGPFTAQEREIFSTHSIVGEEIIRPLEPSPGALALIRHHHENWDGEGYPDHLSGQQIHVLARILRVADSFDSMVSRRPYSSPMPTDEAVHEIWEHSGRAFDPVVAEALAVIMDAELPRHAVAQRISL